MTLPRNISYNLLLTQWPQQLDPIVTNAILQGNAITGVTLNANSPKTFSTNLNRTQQGWFITDILTAAKVWRTEPFNTTTITLEADADTTLSIWVY